MQRSFHIAFAPDKSVHKLVDCLITCIILASAIATEYVSTLPFGCVPPHTSGEGAEGAHMPHTIAKYDLLGGSRKYVVERKSVGLHNEEV